MNGILSLKRFLAPVVLGIWLMSLAIGCSDGGSESEDEEKPDTIDDEDILSSDEELKNDGVSEPPPLLVDPERPGSLQQTVVGIAAAPGMASSISFQGKGCGELADSSGSGPLEVSGKVAESGFCKIVAETDTAIGDKLHYEHWMEIQAGEPNIPPIDIEGAMYIFSPAPKATGGTSAPKISAVNGPETFINGSSSNFSIESEASHPIRQLAIQVRGYDGHFLLPVSSPTGKIDFSISFDSDIMDRLSAADSRKDGLSALLFLLSLIDAAGEVGDSNEYDMDGVEVESGDVKISLSWDTMTDVDLHVTEPEGETIYYGSKVSSTGGQLDLDSNADCDIDGVNHENVFWPEGQSPNGDYTVMAHMFNDCEQGGASGTVTMTFCGEDSPIVEAFSLGATGSSESWTFSNRCVYHVEGKIKYEDFALSKNGLSASGTMVPVRFAAVEVRRASDDELLGEGSTDARGHYSVDFENDEEPGYYVEVLAFQDNARLIQEVLTLDKKLYSWRTEEEYDETEEPDRKDVDIDIMKADDAAALNIWEVGVACSTYARIYSGKAMPKAEFYFTDGQKPFGKNSSFCTRDNKIYILGSAADSDAYDDVILGHEYGHFVMNAIGKSDSPGGGHSSNNQEVPTLAWSEGWATFFGVTANNVTAYMDTDSGGMGVYYSIETPPATKPRGNKDGKLDGNLSEAIAAAVLLDLFDSANESKDSVSNIAAWTVLSTYLGKDNAKFKDRGVAGRDLVDFLDGWFCLGFGEKGEDDKTGVRGVVKGLAGLSYDFPDLASCE